tara:strand:+ start:279 stop:644 length:366 start_codon:yes stop_codon:yes gene_type:complete
MANPNLVNVTSITGESVTHALTTTLTDDILVAASDTLAKVNSIIVANIDGSSAANVSIFVKKSGGSPVAIASTVAVPADSTLVVIDKNSAIYLEEGDTLEGGASANGDLVCVVNFEILNDA